MKNHLLYLLQATIGWPVYGHRQSQYTFTETYVNATLLIVVKGIIFLILCPKTCAVHCCKHLFDLFCNVCMDLARNFISYKLGMSDIDILIYDLLQSKNITIIMIIASTAVCNEDCGVALAL